MKKLKLKLLLLVLTINLFIVTGLSAQSLQVTTSVVSYGIDTAQIMIHITNLNLAAFYRINYDVYPNYNNNNTMAVRITATSDTTIFVVLRNLNPNTKYAFIAEVVGSVNAVSDVGNFTTKSCEIVISTSGDVSICKGEKTQLAVSGVDTYVWSPSSGLNTTIGDTIIASPTVTTTYTVIGRKGNCTVTATIVVTVISIHLNVSSTTTICKGSSIPLIASGVDTYSWSPVDGLNNPNIANPIATPSITTTYTVTGNKGTCFQTASVVVIVENIHLNVSTTDTTICINHSVQLFATGAVTYSWSPSYGLNTVNGASVLASPSTTVTYTVTGRTTSCAATASIVVNVINIHLNISNNITICQGSNAQLLASGADTYVWYPSYGLSDANISNPIANPAFTTTYTVTGTKGSCSKTATVVVTVQDTSNTLVTPTSAILDCSSPPVTFTASGGTSYLWSNGVRSSKLTTSLAGIYTVTITGNCGILAVKSVSVEVTGNSGLTATIATQGSTSVCDGKTVPLTFSGSAGILTWLHELNGKTDILLPKTTSINVAISGNYWAQVQVGNCISSSNVIPVLVNSLPAKFNILPGDTVFCEGNNIVEYVSLGSGFKYHWSTGDTTSGIFISSSGSYALTITDTNGCKRVSNKSVIIGVSKPPKLTRFFYGDTSFCFGKSVRLGVSSNSSVNYLWNTGATSSIITATESGIYSVTATDKYGCSSFTQTIVTQRDELKPIISSESPLTICQGDTVILDANPSGFLYQWNNGAKTSSVKITRSGDYDFIMSDEFGCKSTSSSLTVKVNDRPVVHIVTPSGGGRGDKTVSVSGGEAPYTYLWSNGATTKDVSVGNGVCSVTVTDANGCSNDTKITVFGVGINELENKDQILIKIYPNPFNDIIHVEIPYGKYEITLFDDLGKVVKKEKMEGENINIQTGDFKRGLYLLQISSEKGIIFYKKVIAE